VILIVSEVFGRVNVPFPEYVMLRCVWFIGVWLVVLIRSCWIGFGDNSIPDGEEGVVVLVDDDDVVAVVLLVVVAAATGVVTILNATAIIVSVKIVDDIAITLFSFLLLRRCITSLSSTNTSDKRIPLKEFAGAISQRCTSGRIAEGSRN
jgi:hypothetical protein